ncbi:hypothetical protein SAMN06265222_110165 [Neorhodopirellula lusitana]|uniref:Uncharacterized protein n=1 Tax=Neorhodopirellula lusitana TaxID=445327 RepID=A0ABY1QDM0_9BACT|nr:hypothetical protein [Neorhodopirellula lusitana]SMP67401.1 hypothetical protein SAMN06265222_110165 [Neorhodopirellula lusitana]
MANHQNRFGTPLDHHVRATPISGISNSRMICVEHDRQARKATGPMNENAAMGRESQLPVNRIAGYEMSPWPASIEAVDSCFSHVDDFLLGLDDE